MSDKCIVHNCSNHKHEGSFVGDICTPCFTIITTGVVGPTDSFIGELERENFRLKMNNKEMQSKFKATEAEKETPTSPLRKSDLKPGTQILYIPNHADGDPCHMDCESGFVTSVMETKDFAFCRYWKSNSDELRTKANSEATPIINLVMEKSKPDELVEEMIEKIEKEVKKWVDLPEVMT